MRINLNLATRPFGRDRLFYVASAAAATILCAVALIMVVLFARSYKQSPELKRQADALNRQLTTLTQKQAQLEAVLHRSENSVVLERSIFLNELLYRKGISWTRTFADLEQLMPPRVRLINVRPQINPNHELSLEMQVGSETREGFVEFLKALESSALFHSPELRMDSAPTENQPLFRYTVSVNYEQKL